MFPNSKKYKNGNHYRYYSLLGILVFAIFSYIYWTGDINKINKAGPYIQIITLVIFAITGLITVQGFKMQMDERSRSIGIQYANLTQGKTGDVDKLFLSTPLLNRLYFQMYASDPHIQNIMQMQMQMSRNEDVSSIEQLKAEHIACNLLFQKIADIYAVEKLDTGEDSEEWLNTFRGWMQSPILRSHWKHLQYEQHPEVREFVNTLIIK